MFVELKSRRVVFYIEVVKVSIPSGLLLFLQSGREGDNGTKRELREGGREEGVSNEGVRGRVQKCI